MTSISTLNNIINPYISEGNKELPFYNSSLEARVEEIRGLIFPPDSEEKKLAESWIRKLQNYIQTNNHYVTSKRLENPKFSVHFCTLTRDLPGLKYLLRAGENPNEMKNGKAPIHIAAIKGYTDVVKILKQCPQCDFTLKTRKGKTAEELAANAEIRQILQ